MPFPLIPILALAMIAGGVGTLAWYHNLSENDKDEANERANLIAVKMFNKALEDLSKSQAKKVYAEVKKEIDS